MYEDGEMPAHVQAACDDDQAWDAYDAQDQDLRRARWAGIAAAWALADDDMVQKLLTQLPLAELIDLDSSLTNLRIEVRRVIADGNPPPQLD